MSSEIVNQRRYADSSDGAVVLLDVHRRRRSDHLRFLHGQEGEHRELRVHHRRHRHMRRDSRRTAHRPSGVQLLRSRHPWRTQTDIQRPSEHLHGHARRGDRRIAVLRPGVPRSAHIGGIGRRGRRLRHNGSQGHGPSSGVHRVHDSGGHRRNHRLPRIRKPFIHPDRR